MIQEKLLEINSVCKKIEDSWKKTDNSVDKFPEVVLKHTQDIDLTWLGNLANIAKLLDNPYIAKIQKMTTFSDCYLMLWHNGRFHVEILNWWGLDINIHDHNFSGVQFQLLGNSLNVVYEVDHTNRTSRFAKRDIKVKRAELWKEGSHSLVLPGDAEPHTVHHMSLPTVSLLFRTVPCDDYGPQLNYFPPNVSASYSIADEIFRKKVEALRALNRGSSSNFRSTFNEILESNSLTENLFLIAKLSDILFAKTNKGLMLGFANNGENEKYIVSAIAFRRASEFLLREVCKETGLNESEKLCTSILAAAFDADSCSKICQSLADCGIEIHFSKSLQSVFEKITPWKKIELVKILALYGLDFPPSNTGLNEEESFCTA